MNKVITPSCSAFWISLIFLFLVSNVYYPKWKAPQTEATLSWDVSGYYFYLPAFLIYKDPKKLQFKDEILQKYQPTWNFQQAYLDEKSGNYVMKYSCGLAVQYLPFFGLAHAYASVSESFEADGFSLPYQMAISLGSLLVAIIGLWFLRKILLRYFGEWTTALTILCIVFGTNYLDYTAINGAMSHNYLFTLYTLLIWQTIQFYEKPNTQKAFFIGAIIGIMALTRPTEILACLIPILWFWGGESFKELLTKRFEFIKKHFSKYLLAACVTLMIGSIQLFYWKYITGNWIVYSYQNQGFSWLSPHFLEGIFSYQSGWLVYSPMMVFSLLGFYFLKKQRRSIFWATFIFSILFIYITFAWDEWMYGGGLGIRAMVQGYVILAFPLAAFISWVMNSETKFRHAAKLIFGVIGIVFCLYNLWWTHQAHKGTLYKQAVMTKAYFWKVLGKFEVEKEAIKLLDTDEEFIRERKNINQLLFENFEGDSSKVLCEIKPIQGTNSLCLNKENQYSPSFEFSKKELSGSWIRVTADFKIEDKQWDTWKMTQIVIQFLNKDEIVKNRAIRVQRLLNPNSENTIFLDSEIPNQVFDRVKIYFWNGNGIKPILIDNLVIETYTS